MVRIPAMTLTCEGLNLLEYWASHAEIRRPVLSNRLCGFESDSFLFSILIWLPVFNLDVLVLQGYPLFYQEAVGVVVGPGDIPQVPFGQKASGDN